MNKQNKNFKFVEKFFVLILQIIHNLREEKNIISNQYLTNLI